MLLAPRRRDHPRVPAPRPAHRGQPVRHDLPRALLVLLVRTAERGPRRARPARRSTSRSCRPTAARCGCTPATPTTAARRRPSASARCCERERAARLRRRSAGYRAFDEQVEQTKRDMLAFLIERQARRQDGRRLRGAGQGQHAAQLLRHPDRPRSTTRSTATRTSTADSRPGTHIPIHRSGAARARPARLHPDPALEPARRDRRAARRTSASGAPGSSCRSRTSSRS